MSNYCTVADVAAELGGVTINSASTITDSTVQQWITQTSNEIEELFHRVFTTAVVTSDAYEYHDYNGSGRIVLDYYPVISVQSVEVELNGLGAATENWVALNIARSGDVTPYLSEGVLLVNPTTKTRPLFGTKNVRVCYTYGCTTTPYLIKHLCALLVAKRYIIAVASNGAAQGGGAVSVGTIRVDDPNNYVHNHLDHINEEILTIEHDYASLIKPWIYDSTLYDN